MSFCNVTVDESRLASHFPKHSIFYLCVIQNQTSCDGGTEAGRFILSFPVWDSESSGAFQGALGWGHALSVCVAEQVTALFVAPPLSRAEARAL